MLDAGSAHPRLMIVVADRVFVREFLEQRRVVGLHVVERHRGAAALVFGAGIGRDHKRKEVIEAADRVGRARIGDVAIRLLPRLVKPMRRVAGVGIVGQIRTGQLKRPVRQAGVVGDTGIGPARPSLAGGAGGEQEQIIGLQRRLDCRQLGLRQAGDRRRGRARLVRCVMQRRRRQDRIGYLLCDGDPDVIARLRPGGELPGGHEIRPGRTVRLDDSLRQQVED
jgi:hypothetical protein